MIYELISFVGLDVCHLGVSRDRARVFFGEPDRIIKRPGRKIIQESWHRLGIYLVFNELSLMEINIRPPVIKGSEIKDNIDFIFLHYDIFGMLAKYIYSELCRLDGNPVVDSGVTFLPGFGVGLSGFDDYSPDEQDDRSFGMYIKTDLDDYLQGKNRNK